MARGEQIGGGLAAEQLVASKERVCRRFYSVL
jgi:hypothetical protein